MGVKPLRSRGQPLTLEELETVYRRDGAAFERVAIAIVRDEQLGCDAVHDAFVLAVGSRERFRRHAPVEAWLWRIVINEARKRRAHEARLLAIDPGELDGSAALNGATRESAHSSPRCQSGSASPFFFVTTPISTTQRSRRRST
jgi:DNA-directed RNA polymerase specialized sigma24 family protein